MRTTLLSVIFLILYFGLVDARRICNPCRTDDECNKKPIEKCSHGLSRNYCNRLVCAKGPGERCGGPSGVLGDCGEGMRCKSERCNGCSIHTIECFSKEDF